MNTQEYRTLYAKRTEFLQGPQSMKIHLPNSANLQNITNFLSTIDFTCEDRLDFSMHEKWVAVHPVVLAMTACLAAKVRHDGGDIAGNVHRVSTLPYLIRMGLFRYLGIDPGQRIAEHDESGRFIPITQISSTDELKAAITNLIPLLHAEAEVANPIRYVFSEMVRNVLEHSRSPVGAFVSAQYYRESGRIAIGIADCALASTNTSDSIIASKMRAKPYFWLCSQALPGPQAASAGINTMQALVYFLQRVLRL